MTEIQMFQPGKAFYDAYQQGRGNHLAGLAMNSQGEQRQSALAQLAGIDAGAAQAMKKGFDDQDRAELAEFSNVILNVPDELKPQVYAKGVQRFGQKFRDLGIEPPTDYTQAMPLFQQFAGNGRGAMPSDVQSFEYFTKGMTPEQIRQARENKLGLNKAGEWKTTIDPDTKIPVQSNGLGGFRYFDFDTRQWIDISEPKAGGDVPEENVAFNSLPPEEQEAVALVGNKIGNHYAIRNGKVVPEVNPAGYYGQNEQPATQAARTNPLAKTKDEKIETWGQPFEVMKDGKLILVERSNLGNERVSSYQPKPDASKASTADEKSAKGYLDRMIAADAELNKLVDEGFTPNVRDHYTAGEGAAFNWMASPKGQVWRQQQEDWVRAKLRRESGAAIPPEEMDREIKTYFPQPGDSKAVMESKRKSREMAQQQFRTMAGRAGGDTAASPAQNAPKPGDVVKGYRFKGGNPASPQSWEKL